MPEFDSFTGALRRRVAERPGHVAVRFRAGDGDERLTYAKLDLAARAVAAAVRARTAPADRVLLSCAPGTAFLKGFLGCLYAGRVPVPVPPPGGRAPQTQRTAGIARDTGAELLLTDMAEALSGDGLGVPTILTVQEALRADPSDWTPPLPERQQLAFLQYTSGSTSEPKGVMVHHGALAHNLALMRDSHGWHGGMTWCSWLPAYHDMGLIAMMLAPLYLGGTAVLMPATDFLKRPVSWLRLIDRCGAEISCAPNFAYELCARLGDEQIAGLDLSRWRYACNGAEPVDARTLARFAERFRSVGLKPSALLPGYGLAEATLYVSGTPVREEPAVFRVDPAALEQGRLAEASTDAVEVAASGVVRGLDVRIVDPIRLTETAPGVVGEVWIRGRSVAQGYWRRPEETARTFGGTTAGGDGGFLRTGDLGAFHDGKLVVTGRLKEIIIVHGRNLYPHDLEREVQALDPAFDGLPATVFAVRPPGRTHEEIVVTQEIRGRGVPVEDLQALARRARTALARRLGVAVAGLVLLRVGRTRRTTSGKIQRNLMRDLFLRGELEAWHEELDPALHGGAARPLRTPAATGGARS
ncbi:acyl-CoA synthetase (AMP-forming)/AMP-acid ligase II [Micromonospora sp. A202]|uniref:fatty acyl-AMP ligase n=1 Tax=Micromonospora sp. A202 TaxID=2572899 RepID=UPI00116E3B0A|nr:fatty acyl-AMP ligase [Micromonospora sp. A202]TQJ23658.1 acyl-CoA synthetase (AMP-forming)/AMP-acid ligase II [Micromonospora sp. A202]